MEVPLVPEPLQNPAKPFPILIAGIKGEGRALTALRQAYQEKYGDAGLVYSSVSGPLGLKNGEKTLTDHHRNVADEAIVRSDGRPIEIHGYSLGGDEMIGVAREMVRDPRMEGREVTLNFVSTPGIGEKGIKAVASLLRNFTYMTRDWPQVEQHMAYPLSEAYYAQFPPQAVEAADVTTIYKDTPQERALRKQEFERNMEKILPDPSQRERLYKQVNELDTQIDQGMRSGLSIDALLKQRGKLLQPHIQKLFDADHIDEATHDSFLKKYRETKETLSFSAKVAAQALLGFLTKVGTGMDTEVKDVVREARAKNVNVKVAITMIERDVLVPLHQMEKIRHNLTDEELGLMPQFFYLQQLAHSTISYHPEPLTRT